MVSSKSLQKFYLYEITLFASINQVKKPFGKPLDGVLFDRRVVKLPVADKTKKIILAACLIGLLGIRTTTPAHAVNYLDGAHPPDGFYQLAYMFWYTADRITDSKGKTAVDDLGLDNYGLVIRPLYYHNDFIFAAFVPIETLEVDAFDDSDGGIGDIVLGVGYFLPVKWADIIAALQVKIPTGHFDKDDAVNIGDGQWDIRPELYLNKFVGKFSFDLALKYWVRLEIHSNGWKPGNEFHAEALVTYGITGKLRFGPSVKLLRGADGELDGVRFDDTASRRLSLGAELIYQTTPRLQFLLTVLEDVETENAADGTLVMGRVSYAF